MKRRIISIMLVVLSIGLLLTACSDDNKSKSVEGKSTGAINSKSSQGVNSDSKITVIEGKYEGSIGYFEFKKDGRFLLDAKFIITGKYTLNGEELELNNEKMNGEELGTVVTCKFKGDYLIDPNGITFTKSK